MQNDFIITLAWPEGMVAASGAWYDKILSKNGKYRVGHSAVVLINSETSKSHYFDFGRYHTPQGFGRARDVETDGDLALLDAVIKNGKIFENSIEDIVITYNRKFKVLPSSSYFHHKKKLNWGLGSIFADLNKFRIQE